MVQKCRVYLCWWKAQLVAKRKSDRGRFSHLVKAHQNKVTLFVSIDHQKLPLFKGGASVSLAIIHRLPPNSLPTVSFHSFPFRPHHIDPSPPVDLSMTLPYKEALHRLENRRVKATRPLIPPQILQEDLPLSVLVSILGHHC